MIGDIADVSRKEALIVLVDSGRHVRPPEKSLHKGGAIVEPDLQLEQSRTRTQAHAMHAFHPVHRLVLAKPHDAAAVSLILDGEVHRHECARSMVLRPVELDAAADPWTGQSDEGGLDDILAIDEVVAVRLVTGDMDAAAQLRKDHHADELIFQVNGGPCAVVRGVGDAIAER